jgi:hypothetical protein
MNPWPDKLMNRFIGCTLLAILAYVAYVGFMVYCAFQGDGRG